MKFTEAVDRIELTAQEGQELLFGSGKVRGDGIEVAIPEEERLSMIAELVDND